MTEDEPIEKISDLKKENEELKKIITNLQLNTCSSISCKMCHRIFEKVPCDKKGE